MAEQATLEQRAEKAEDQFAQATSELSSLRQYISKMTGAIFGPRSANLQDDSVLKLKAIYTLTEQLYDGGLFTVMAVWGDKDLAKCIKDMLRRLAIIPQHIAKIRKSSARKGVMAARSRALSYAPELKPDEIAGGFPEYKDDGSEFTEEDYAKCVKDISPAASGLAESLDLLKYQSAYGDEGRRMATPSFAPLDLAPQRRKPLFAPDADPSTMLTDEAEFHTLINCTWDVDNFQIQDPETSAQDEPAAA